MDTHAGTGPDDDLPELWVVPLNEPPVADGAAPPLPPSAPEPPHLFQPDDAPPDVGFHPRLRRFDEAA